MVHLQLASGKRLHHYGKSPFSMGKWTISMAIFTSKLFVYQRVTVMISEVSWIWWSSEDPLLCLTVKPLAEKSDVDPNGWGLLKVLTFQNSPCIHMCVYNNIYVCIVLLVHTYIHNIYIYIYIFIHMWRCIHCTCMK